MSCGNPVRTWVKMPGMASDHDRNAVRFGREIIRARRKAGITQSRLARQIGVSSSHLSNIERGTRTPTPSLVGALDYALDEGGRLIRVWDDLTGAGRPAWLSELAEREREALSIQEFQLVVFPGVLQIEEYARALIKRGTLLSTSAEIEAMLEDRMARAQRFASAEEPAMRLVVDISAIKRRIGGDAVTAEQLAHVVQMIESGRVAVQISDGLDAYPGMRGPFAIFSSCDAPDVVYAESAYSGQIIDEPDTVHRFRLAFGDIQAAARSPESSLRLIQEELEGIGHE